MSTALDVLKTAMRLIGALEAGEAPSGEEGVDGLASLNAMLHSFPADGIHYAHTTLATQATTIPIPEEVIDHVAHVFADRIAPEYGTVISPKLEARIENARRALQGYYFLPKTVPVEAALRSPSASDYDWANS